MRRLLALLLLLVPIVANAQKTNQLPNAIQPLGNNGEIFSLDQGSPLVTVQAPISSLWTVPGITANTRTLQLGATVSTPLPFGTANSLWYTNGATGGVTLAGFATSPGNDVMISPFEIYVAADTADTTNGSNTSMNYFSSAGHATAGHAGGRTGVNCRLFIDGTPTSLTNAAYSCLVGVTSVKANLTGTTGVYQNYKGSVYGGNSNVFTQSGATFLNQVTGHEFDVAVTLGASAAEKLGMDIVQTGTDSLNGVYEDAAIKFSAQDRFNANCTTSPLAINTTSCTMATGTGMVAADYTVVFHNAAQDVRYMTCTGVDPTLSCSWSPGLTSATTLVSGKDIGNIAPWKKGLDFASYANLSPFWSKLTAPDSGVFSGSTLIGFSNRVAGGAMTANADIGIDFSNVNFSSYSMRLPGITMDPTGNILAKTVNGQLTEYAVRNYGAKCDGVTDDGPAYSAMISAGIIAAQNVANQTGAMAMLATRFVACGPGQSYVGTPINATGITAGLTYPGATGPLVAPQDITFDFTGTCLIGATNGKPVIDMFNTSNTNWVNLCIKASTTNTPNVAIQEGRTGPAFAAAASNNFVHPVITGNYTYATFYNMASEENNFFDPLINNAQNSGSSTFAVVEDGYNLGVTNGSISSSYQTLGRGFNGTITGASGTSATLTVNSGTNPNLADTINGASLSGTTVTSGNVTITSGAGPFTLTCLTTCANVSAEQMSASGGATFNGTITGASGTTATLTVNSGINPAIGNTISGAGIAVGPFTLTCASSCVNVAAESMTGNAVLALSFQHSHWYGGTISMNSTAAGSAAVWLGDVAGHEFLGTYINSDSPQNVIVYNTTANALSVNYSLRFVNVHMEHTPSLKQNFLLTSDVNATVALPSFVFTENNDFAYRSVFAMGGAVTAVQMPNAWIQPDVFICPSAACTNSGAISFNGTITGASGTTATLTVNSGTAPTLASVISGAGLSTTTTVTSGTNPTFTLTCVTACVNVAAEAMTANNGAPVTIFDAPSAYTGSGYLANNQTYAFGVPGAITTGSITTAGSSLTNGTYTGVAATGGHGSNATFNITVAGGITTVMTLVNQGTGYQNTDVLSVAVGNIGGTGTAPTWTVSALGGTQNVVTPNFNGTLCIKLACTTNNGASTNSGLMTGAAGLTVTGGTVSLDASSNFSVNIGTGTSTATTTIGNPSGTGSGITLAAPITEAMGSAISLPTWGFNGVAFQTTGGTFNDTTPGSAGVNSDAAYSWGGPTFTNLQGTTPFNVLTNAINGYFATPVCGTGWQSCTNLWSIWANGAAKVGGLLSGSGGALISGAAITFNNNSNFVTSINTGTSTGALHLADGTGNNAVTISNGTGSINLGAKTISAGTTFTIASGTGACATTTTLTGGVQAGSFLCTGTAGASTVTITLPASTNGWACWGSDVTSGVAFAQSGKATNSCKLTGTIATTSDNVVFGALGF